MSECDHSSFQNLVYCIWFTQKRFKQIKQVPNNAILLLHTVCSRILVYFIQYGPRLLVQTVQLQLRFKHYLPFTLSPMWFLGVYIHNCIHTAYITLHIQEAGDYKICFDNKFSYVSSKTVYFELINENEELDYDDLAAIFKETCWTTICLNF